MTIKLLPGYIFSDNEAGEVIQATEIGDDKLLQHYIGYREGTVVGVDNVVEFYSFSTVAAPSVSVEKGQKAWYEVTFLEGTDMSYSQIGWANCNFKESDDYLDEGVGDDTSSWSFDGQRVCKCFNGNITSWGKEVEVTGNHVLGVAADLETGQILFGIDGDWGEPMGVAFDSLEESSLYPALTGENIVIDVNFGEKAMKFSPPDETFKEPVATSSKFYEFIAHNYH